MPDSSHNMVKRMHWARMRLKEDSLSNFKYKIIMLQQIIFKTKKFAMESNSKRNVNQHRRMVREDLGQVFEMNRVKSIEQAIINQTLIKPGPTSSMTKLTIAPRKIGTRVIDINQRITCDKIRKEIRFPCIIAKVTS